eukprot:jgi/Astpho2/8517/Aster-x0359
MPPVPEEFLCPISLDIMTDPVIMIETAMNYDRSSIEQHFACGNEICPLSGRVLLNKRMIPNYNLKHAIENWCRQHNISLAALAERNVAMAREQSSAAEEMPSVLESDSLSSQAAMEFNTGRAASSPARCNSSELLDTVPPPLPDDVVGLITLLSQAARGKTAPQAVEAATRRIGEMVDADSAARVAVRECGGIAVLVDQLGSGMPDGSRTAAARALWFMARDDDNTHAISQSGAIGPLTQLLWGGPDDAKEASARAFWNMSTYNSQNKVAIANAGAVPALVQLLSYGTFGGKEAAAGALRSLAVNDEIEVQIVRAGAIPPLVSLLAGSHEACREVALGALHNLTSRSDYRVEFASAGCDQALHNCITAPGMKPELVAHAKALLKRML